MFFIIWGTVTGMMQWSVLRRHLYQADWWVSATVAGCMIAGHPLINYADNAVIVIVYSVLFGIMPGMMQWLVLRQQVYQAGWWILASFMGYGVPFALFETESNGLIFGVVLFIMLAVMSGVVMTWLLRHPRPRV
ncbi:MAG: hypothetical protein F6J86_17135 [Symploca sp. SIO1B1]|nr:hypothetical protein [Symploca sp. SIO1B1]